MIYVIFIMLRKYHRISKVFLSTVKQQKFHSDNNLALLFEEFNELAAKPSLVQMTAITAYISKQLSWQCSPTYTPQLQLMLKTIRMKSNDVSLLVLSSYVGLYQAMERYQYTPLNQCNTYKAFLIGQMNELVSKLGTFQQWCQLYRIGCILHNFPVQLQNKIIIILKKQRNAATVDYFSEIVQSEIAVNEENVIRGINLLMRNMRVARGHIIPLIIKNIFQIAVPNEILISLVCAFSKLKELKRINQQLLNRVTYLNEKQLMQFIMSNIKYSVEVLQIFYHIRKLLLTINEEISLTRLQMLYGIDKILPSKIIKQQIKTIIKSIRIQNEAREIYFQLISKGYYDKQIKEGKFYCKITWQLLFAIIKRKLYFVDCIKIINFLRNQKQRTPLKYYLRGATISMLYRNKSILKQQKQLLTKIYQQELLSVKQTVMRQKKQIFQVWDQGISQWYQQYYSILQKQFDVFSRLDANDSTKLNKSTQFWIFLLRCFPYQSLNDQYLQQMHHHPKPLMKSISKLPDARFIAMIERETRVLAHRRGDVLLNYLFVITLKLKLLNNGEEVVRCIIGYLLEVSHKVYKQSENVVKIYFKNLTFLVKYLGESAFKYKKQLLHLIQMSLNTAYKYTTYERLLIYRLIAQLPMVKEQSVFIVDQAFKRGISVTQQFNTTKAKSIKDYFYRGIPYQNEQIIKKQISLLNANQLIQLICSFNYPPTQYNKHICIILFQFLHEHFVHNNTQQNAKTLKFCNILKLLQSLKCYIRRDHLPSYQLLKGFISLTINHQVISTSPQLILLLKVSSLFAVPCTSYCYSLLQILSKGGLISQPFAMLQALSFADFKFQSLRLQRILTKYVKYIPQLSLVFLMLQQDVLPKYVIRNCLKMIVSGLNVPQPFYDYATAKYGTIAKNKNECPSITIQLPVKSVLPQNDGLFYHRQGDKVVLAPVNSSQCLRKFLGKVLERKLATKVQIISLFTLGDAVRTKEEFIGQVTMKCAELPLIQNYQLYFHNR